MDWILSGSAKINPLICTASYSEVNSLFLWVNQVNSVKPACLFKNKIQSKHNDQDRHRSQSIKNHIVQFRKRIGQGEYTTHKSKECAYRHADKARS